MVIKKKLIKFFCLFILVLSLQTIFFTTCFASDYTDEFTQSELDQVNNFFNTDISLWGINYGYNNLKNWYADRKNISVSKLNIVFFRYTNSSNQDNIYMLPNNGTFSSSLDYVFLDYINSNRYIKFITNGSNLNSSNAYISYLSINCSGNFSTVGNLVGYLNMYGSSSIPTISVDTTFLTSNALLTTKSTAPIYYSSSGNTAQSYFSTNYITLDIDYVEPEPEEPSGDTSGDISGDVPVSPSGESGGGTIDYTNQLNNINTSINSLQNQISGDSQSIINQISGDNEKIINALTDSTTEITTEDFEDSFNDMLSTTENVVDPTTNFFSWLIDNIRSVLNSTGNYDITITLFDNTYTIHSDFFTLPDGDLKSFLQMSFIAWFGWRIIKKIRYIVYAVQCVKITSALDHSDFNADII